MDTIMNLSHTLGTSYPISIQLLTPLHIGCGQSLSPYADYVLDNQKNVCLLDTDRLNTLLYEKGQVDSYIKQVIGSSTEDKTHVLSQFVQHQLKSDISLLKTGQVLPGQGIKNPILIDRCATTDGQPYIAASTIKGAIRSALLHNWLREGSDESRKALQTFLDKLTSFARRSDMNESAKVKETENQFTKLIEDVFLGDIKQNNRLPLSCLRIHDTPPAPPGCTGFWQVDRVNLANGDISQYSIKECVQPGTVLHTTIHIDFYGHRTHHALLDKIKDKKGLFDLLYQYAYDNLEHEWMQLGMIDSGIQNKTVQQYDAFVEGLKTAMEASSGSVSFLRLGAGKTQLYQTIGNALYKHIGNDDDNAQWCTYLDFLARFKKINRQVYPVTRVLATTGQVPFGWTQLT
jgi:CRISPR-associated protein Csm5